MRNDMEIKDDIFDFLKDSSLVAGVTGSLYKSLRPSDSICEDVVISVLANINGQIQEAYVNVNIYVPDIYRRIDYIEDSSRLRHLAHLAADTLEVGRGLNYRFVLEEQRIFAVNGRNEHCINNKLFYKHSNE